MKINNVNFRKSVVLKANSGENLKNNNKRRKMLGEHHDASFSSLDTHGNKKEQKQQNRFSVQSQMSLENCFSLKHINARGQ